MPKAGMFALLKPARQVTGGDLNIIIMDPIWDVDAHHDRLGRVEGNLLAGQGACRSTRQETGWVSRTGCRPENQHTTLLLSPLSPVMAPSAGASYKVND